MNDIETKWCKNELAVSGKPSALAQFVARAEGWDEQEPYKGSACALSFNSLVPLGFSSTFLDELAEWGCKGGACEVKRQLAPVSEPVNATYQFSTPWSPPMVLLNRVAKDFPDLEFQLAYEGPDSEFLGVARWEQGKLIRDECRGSPSKSTS